MNFDPSTSGQPAAWLAALQNTQIAGRNRDALHDVLQSMSEDPTEACTAQNLQELGATVARLRKTPGLSAADGEYLESLQTWCAAEAARCQNAIDRVFGCDELVLNITGSLGTRRDVTSLGSMCKTTNRVQKDAALKEAGGPLSEPLDLNMLKQMAKNKTSPDAALCAQRIIEAANVGVHEVPLMSLDLLGSQVPYRLKKSLLKKDKDLMLSDAQKERWKTFLNLYDDLVAHLTPWRKRRDSLRLLDVPSDVSRAEALDIKTVYLSIQIEGDLASLEDALSPLLNGDAPTPPPAPSKATMAEIVHAHPNEEDAFVPVWEIQLPKGLLGWYAPNAHKLSKLMHRRVSRNPRQIFNRVRGLPRSVAEDFIKAEKRLRELGKAIVPTQPLYPVVQYSSSVSWEDGGSSEQIRVQIGLRLPNNRDLARENLGAWMAHH